MDKQPKLFLCATTTVLLHKLRSFNQLQAVQPPITKHLTWWPTSVTSLQTKPFKSDWMVPMFLLIGWIIKFQVRLIWFKETIQLWFKQQIPVVLIQKHYSLTMHSVRHHKLPQLLLYQTEQQQVTLTLFTTLYWPILLPTKFNLRSTASLKITASIATNSARLLLYNLGSIPYN